MITLRVPEIDEELIRMYADVNGISVSDFMRQAALKQIEDTIDLETYKAVLKQVEDTVEHRTLGERLGIK